MRTAQVEARSSRATKEPEVINDGESVSANHFALDTAGDGKTSLMGANQKKPSIGSRHRVKRFVSAG